MLIAIIEGTRNMMGISKDYGLLSVMGLLLPAMLSVHCILSGAEVALVTRWCQYWILLAISTMAEITVLHKVRSSHGEWFLV